MSLLCWSCSLLVVSRRAENCGFHSCSSCLVVYMPVVVHDKFGVFFGALCTGTRPGLTPAIRAGKGWRGRRELAPRCSATQLAARRHDPGQRRRVLNPPYHTHHTSTHKHTQTHTNTHKHTQTHTNTHKHTQTHTNTHQHIQPHTTTHTTPHGDRDRKKTEKEDR